MRVFSSGPRARQACLKICKVNRGSTTACKTMDVLRERVTKHQEHWPLRGSSRGWQGTVTAFLGVRLRSEVVQRSGLPAPRKRAAIEQPFKSEVHRLAFSLK